jgi:hypothetical protein
MRRGQPNKKKIQCWMTRDHDNLLGKKKEPDLTRVKIPKLKPWSWDQHIPIKKQRKTNYEAQFSTNPILNDKI